MSEKKPAAPPPKPKPKPAPAKGSPFLSTLMMLIVLLIAGACITVAMTDSPESAGPTELHSTQPTETKPSTTEAAPTEADSTEAASTEPDSTEPTTEAGPQFDRSLLILVNAWSPLSGDYEVELKKLSGWPLSVAEVAYDDLQKMIMDGMAEGLYFWVCSAYRSVEEQEQLFNEDVQRYLNQGYSQAMAETEAALYTQRPGCSEHHTGLAVDIVAKSYQLLDDAQENTPEIQWLQKHCHEYGFILRYPKDKEGETGISYESWHFRYVGREAAVWLTENNLTLEEYWSTYAS